MIKSMTGFGRFEYSDDTMKVTVELKSVNHRYLETAIKMPKQLNFFEVGIRNELKKYIQRGKVDVFITYEDLQQDKMCLTYNDSLAAEYMDIFSRMEKQFGINNDVNVSSLSRYPEVITMENISVDEDALWQKLSLCISSACEKFVESRIKEGEHLKNDLIEKLDEMMKNVEFIEERSPQIIAEYKEKLENRVKEFLADKSVDESRIATEVVLYADKICVDEEIVRLKSHIKNTKDVLLEGGSVGRKLDFIAQELNREANTILSKTTDLAITNVAIELKTSIEKVREQIQNIE